MTPTRAAAIDALDLFSGIGGFALACRNVGIQTVAFCESDPFCKLVLAKNFPGIPIYPDIRELDPAVIPPVDLVTGGFPCQDISAAGKGSGIGGTRSSLWFEMARILRHLRPRWALIENVPALRTRGADRVLSDLEEIGYSCWPFVVGAWSVGAPHRRDRVWIVANAAEPRLPGDSGRQETRSLRDTPRRQESAGSGRRMAHAGSQRRQQVSGSAYGDEASDAGRTEKYDHELASSGQGMADANRGRREEFRLSHREPEHEGAPGCEPNRRDRESVADASGGGHGKLRRRHREARDADERDEDLADPDRAGFGEHSRTVAVFEEQPPAERDGLWPARPGEPQHHWEEPRLVAYPARDEQREQPAQERPDWERTWTASDGQDCERLTQLPLGGPTHGLPARLVRSARRNNREALKAYGNSIVPQIAEMILHSILNTP